MRGHTDRHGVHHAVNINDAILKATAGPTLNEGLLAWYRGNGATSYDIQDAENEFLTARSAPAGQIADRWFAYLGTLTYTGSLDDRRYQYWTARAVNIWNTTNILAVTNTTVNATQAIITAPITAGQVSFRWNSATAGDVPNRTFRLRFTSNGVAGQYRVTANSPFAQLIGDTPIEHQQEMDITFTIPSDRELWEFRAGTAGLTAGTCENCTLQDITP